MNILYAPCRVIALTMEKGNSFCPNRLPLYHSVLVGVYNIDRPKYLLIYFILKIYHSNVHICLPQYHKFINLKYTNLVFHTYLL